MDKKIKINQLLNELNEDIEYVEYCLNNKIDVIKQKYFAIVMLYPDMIDRHDTGRCALMDMTYNSRTHQACKKNYKNHPELIIYMKSIGDWLDSDRDGDKGTLTDYVVSLASIDGISSDIDIEARLKRLLNKPDLSTSDEARVLDQLDKYKEKRSGTQKYDALKALWNDELLPNAKSILEL